MVDPGLLCRQHLLGEHYELHKLAGALRRGKSIDGYLRKGQLEPTELYRRHEVLVGEMIRRGINHKSPLPEVDLSGFRSGYVAIQESLKELHRRCPDCRRVDKA